MKDFFEILPSYVATFGAGMLVASKSYLSIAIFAGGLLAVAVMALFKRDRI